MKSQFAHLKTRAKGIGTRGIAVMLCFVMLLTAVGAGTMMTSFAVKSSDAAVTEAAQEVTDAASVDADPADDSAQPEDSAIIPTISKKVKDLADTGAKVDLAETGWTLQGSARIYYSAASWYDSGNDSDYPEYMNVALIKKTYTNGADGQAFAMTRIANTSVYYVDIPSSFSMGDVEDSGGVMFFSSYTNWSGQWKTDLHLSNVAYWKDKTSTDDISSKSYYMTEIYTKINLYNNHVYYFSSAEKQDYKGPYFNQEYDGNSSTNYVNNKTIWKSHQKVSIYTDYETSGTYTYVGDSNTDKGGTVAVNSRIWNGATSVGNDGDTASTHTNVRYEYAANGVKTTLKVKSIDPGYEFVGWYTSDGTLLSTDLEYSYFNSTVSTNGSYSEADHIARFQYQRESYDYYLTGWINGAAVASASNSYGFKETFEDSGIYTLSYTFSGTAAAQYVTVSSFGDSTETHHPRNHNATSGAPSKTTDSTPNNDPKWKVNAGSGKTVIFTWDTTKTDPVLTWKVLASDESGGSSSSISFDTSGYSNSANTNIQYTSAGDGSSFSSGRTTAGSTVMNKGGKYWILLNSTDLAAWKSATASSKQIRWNLYTNNNAGLTDKSGTSVDTTTNASGLTSKMNDYGGTVFVELSAISSDVTALGIYIDKDNKQVIYYAVTNSGSSSSEDLVNGKTLVTIYAKDGSILGSGGKTYANIADTKIYKSDGTTAAGTSVDGSVSGQSYETLRATAGTTVVIKTTIYESYETSTGNDTVAPRSKYYVRGFNVNGETYYGNGERINTVRNANGVYTLTYTIPEDISGEYIEITPIYYIYDTETYPCVTYRVLGFTDEIQGEGWGDSLYAYPYYGKLHNYNNSFGAYPGQPMICVNGQYSMQIPLSSSAWTFYSSEPTANASNLADVHATAVSGITMSNGWFDAVHRVTQGYGSNDNSTDHLQTYDFDDFYKIYNEKNSADDRVDNIAFQFKYETVNNNREDAENTSSFTKATIESTFTNGFEELVNYHGRQVDLFGNVLNSTQQAATPVYVVSKAGPNGTSGVKNIAGYYATEWYVYAPPENATSVTNNTNLTKVTNGSYSSLPPSVFVLNDISSFNDTTYPSADDTDVITEYQALYTTLKSKWAYHPVMITYEMIKAQEGETSYQAGSNGASRNDGRWLYSKNGETITANIRIDVSKDNGKTYFENPAAGETGHVDNLLAYFTDSDADGERPTSFTTLSDPEKDFNFTALSNNDDYRFDGWYLSDGTKVSSDITSHTERSRSMTLVARFKEVTAGTLTLVHAIDSNGTGTANTEIKVVATSATKTNITYDWTSSPISLDYEIINSDSDYNIHVYLRSTGVTADDTFSKITHTAANAFFGNKTEHTGSSTYDFSFAVSALYNGTTQDVKKVQYTSTYTRPTYTYNITYSYNGRKIGNESANRSFVRTGTLTQAQRNTYVTGDGTTSGATRTLSQDFFVRLAPHESNFNETLIWSFTSKNFVYSEGTYSLTCSWEASVAESGEGIRTTNRTIVFDLPYAYTGDGVPTMTDGKAISGTSANLSFTVEYGDLIKKNNNYISAPEKLYASASDASPLTFQYWLIKDKDNRNEISRCYSKDFNYLAYDSYYIVPHYESGSIDFSQEGASTSITFLETSRNQWNNNGNGGYSATLANATNKAKADNASDLLFNDFALSYGYNGTQFNENGSDVQNVKIGFIVDRFQRMDQKNDGTFDTDVSHYIATGEDATLAANAAITNIKSIVTNTTTRKVASSGNYTKYEFARTDLNNKNRIEFFYTLYNSLGWDTNMTSYGYKNYVYRAYSYIQIGNEEPVLCDNPAYFIMYDEATK